MTKRLDNLIIRMKKFILKELRKKDFTRQQLAKNLSIWFFSIRNLAFIIAYKELEQENLINIQRFDIPFPLTNNNSIFSLKKG